MDARLIIAAFFFWAGQALAFDHSPWDRLLRKNVVVLEEGRSSRVVYGAIDRAALQAYLKMLSGISEAEFKSWPRNEQIAFLINAYNAFAVEKILTRYPDIRSIWDFGKFFGNPFKDEFFSLLGRKSSLDAIEHGMLRKQYRERRVHYALNCASVSCPMLREEAYVAARLDGQLEDQTVRFLSDRSRNRFRDGRLEVSKIFDWFSEDFEPLPEYFRRYAGVLGYAGGEVPISFLDYDWSLNDFRSSSRR
jgi:hypothetical protein